MTVLARRRFVTLAGLGLVAHAVGCGSDGLGEDSDGGSVGEGSTGSSGSTSSSSSSAGTTGTAGSSTTAASTSSTGSSTGMATGEGSTGSDACEPTPPNILGPFYRAGAPARSDLNPLDRSGQNLHIEGRVRSTDCTPIAGALVEIWHADPDGAYDSDTVNFEFRGSLTTDGEGRYAYDTLLCGWYLNGQQYRPRHIHYKVTAPGHLELVTQLYFSGDPYLDIDPFDLPELVIDLADDGAGNLSGNFDIALAPA